MLKKSIRLAFYFFAFLPLLFTDSAEAQILRRQLRRIPALQESGPAGPGYRVGPRPENRGPLLREPLIQGDGRLMDRVMQVIDRAAGGDGQLKPVAVLSLASFEEFKRVLQIVAQEIRLNRGSTEEPALLNAFLSVYERIVGQGFDTRQPIGVLLQTDGVLYYPLVFTPMNLDGPMGKSFQRDYVERLPDGRLAIRQDIAKWPLGRLYVRQHNGWLFIASETQLGALPEDPTVLLQGLDRECLVAARFDLQSLPNLSTRAALSLGEAQAVAQAETELEKAWARLGVGHLRSLAEQADFLEYRFYYDEENNDYILQQEEIVKPGSERARLLQARREATSPFHGFYHPEQAILASHVVMSLTQTQREQLEIIVDESIGKHLLTDQERQSLKNVPAADQTPSRRRAARRRQTAVEPEPQLAPELAQEEPEPTTTPTPAADHRDRLASLLAQPSARTPEELESLMEPEVNFIPLPEDPLSYDTLPERALRDIPEGDLTDREKMQAILREIGVCYYWALIGTVRSGSVDAALTVSQEHGVLGAYNIVEGQRFQESFDRVFAELAKKFPDVYEKRVYKDFGEWEGFRLTKVSFNLADFVTNPLLKSLMPEDWTRRETNVILGVRDDALCFAVGQEEWPENRLMDAVEGMTERLPVYDMFFVFSAYELGRAFAVSGDPDRLRGLKAVAANADPAARAFAVSEFTDTTKVLTLRISALLTPSIWSLRENLRDARWYR